MDHTISIDADHTAGTGRGAADYRFERFKTRHLLADMAFSRDAKRAGETISDAILYTVEGKQTTLRKYAAGRPLLVVAGSTTCPMTVSSLPDLNALYKQYGDRVAFVQLYVREAHR